MSDARRADALTRVHATSAMRNRAITAYRDAIIEARRAGATYRAIGAAAGVTDVAVRRLLARAEERDAA